jgi:hypothetical protein
MWFEHVKASTAWVKELPVKELVCCCWQVYTIVMFTINGSQPLGRTAVCELMERLEQPVQFLQDIFQPISSRVSQVKHSIAAAAAAPSWVFWKHAASMSAIARL